MDFDYILDQAVEMLQRRGRLTYRTLKRQFQLDDACGPQKFYFSCCYGLWTQIGS